MWKSQQPCKRQSKYKQFIYTFYKMKAKLSSAEISELHKNLLKQRLLESWGSSFVIVSSFKVINSAKIFWYDTSYNIFAGNVNKFLIDHYVKSLWGRKLLTMFRKNFSSFEVFLFIQKCLYLYSNKMKKKTLKYFLQRNVNHRKKKSCHCT